MSRFTERHNGVMIKKNPLEANKKLADLEDLMEEYNINSLITIECAVKFYLENVNKVEQLEQENTELKKKLDNAIVPKFKKGDKCYGIIDTFAYTDVFPVEIRNTHLLYEVWDGEDTTKQHSTRIFATEEEAKAKLEELKNG